MAFKNRLEEEFISTKKILLKKVGRLRKQLRTLKMNNASLKSANREMVLTVQMLKGNLKDAETKLKSMHVDLCQAEVARRSMQENFKKLSSLMPELAVLLHGTSSVVTKIYGVMAESVVQDISLRESLEEHRVPNLSDLQIMGDQCLSMNKSSQIAQVILDKVKDINRCYTEKETAPQSQQDLSSRMLNINVTSGQPTVYRLGLNPILSPVPEQNSEVLYEENGRNDSAPIEADSTHVEISSSNGDSANMNSSHSNFVDESSLRTDEDDVFNEEHKDSDEEEEYEEKPNLLHITKKEWIIDSDVIPENTLLLDSQTSITQSLSEINHHRRSEVLRDTCENGSLIIEANDPGYLSNMMSEMSTLPRPQSQNELAIDESHIEAIGKPVTESIQSISNASLEINSTSNTTSNEDVFKSKFTNVFPRKRRAISPIIENNTSCTSTPRNTRSQSLKPEGTPRTSELQLHISNSTLRRSRSLQSLRGSPSSADKRSAKKKKVPTRFSPRLTQITEGRQTRRAIKSYKEPSLNKKLRR